MGKKEADFTFDLLISYLGSRMNPWHLEWWGEIENLTQCFMVAYQDWPGGHVPFSEQV